MAVLGNLTSEDAHRGFASQQHTQSRAWLAEVEILDRFRQQVCDAEPQAVDWQLILEFEIPRRGKRIDAVLVSTHAIFVIEFKIGATDFLRADTLQTEDYALELRDFHSASRERPIVPILVATEAPSEREQLTGSVDAFVTGVLGTNTDGLAAVVVDEYRRCLSSGYESITSTTWSDGAYSPTPTILEAARALYSGHSVQAIAQSEAAAENLERTCDVVSRVVARARTMNKKCICFITGIPGSGKTLAGLNITNGGTHDFEAKSVFLSGNGPLVKVLQEALARDMKHQDGVLIGDARRRSSTFVSNVHRWLDEYIDKTFDAPNEHIVVFDEAQRAWDAEQSHKKFARKGSEAHMMLSVMDRRHDWAVLIALVGGGQEINTGEAGIAEWGRALVRDFPHWEIHASPQNIHGDASTAGTALFAGLGQAPALLQLEPDLHLVTSVRSFRSNRVATWVNHVLDGDVASAAASLPPSSYPIALTRSLHRMKRWLRERARGMRSRGVIASSGARRLRPYGLDVNQPIDAAMWFLNDSDDVRSSGFLELPATEFAIQGLELDWIGLAWGADFRWSGRDWERWQFKGTVWQSVRQTAMKRYILNKYRVLLTRAREGMVIWVPPGDANDATRDPSKYDLTAQFLRQAGAVALDAPEVLTA